MATPRAHYLTTLHGQVRLWTAGEGLPILVLPGLIRAAAWVAAQLVAAAPDLAVYVIELPGIGGSAGVPVGQAVPAIAAAAAALGLADAPVLAFDLAGALCGGLAGPVTVLETVAARAWARRGFAPPDLAPRPDGTHLTALFSHLRDAHVLDPTDPDHAARLGEPLPTAAELDATLVAAAVRPQAYRALWNSCLAGAADLTGPANLTTVYVAIRQEKARRAPAVPPVAPAPPIWCDHVDIPRGRMHLRRAGTGGRPLIALHSAPGSAAPLAPLLAGLASGRAVIAPDYIGNGNSTKGEGAADIAQLAQDVLDLADAMDLARFDLWGTHTGALIALEASLRAPDRVGRLVLEAPPLLPPAFTADILTNYLPKLRPDGWGVHLQQAWNMRRDMFLFWPWYRAERAAVRPLRLPDAAFLHDWTIGLLKSGTTYDISYRAAFEYDTPHRLKLLSRPALVCAGPSDMLADGLRVARDLARGTIIVAEAPATVRYPHQPAADVAETIDLYERFLNG